MFALAASAALLPGVAQADEFAAGSLIIPMDTDFQDLGMLRAYGLVYQLLYEGVPVRWVIRRPSREDHQSPPTIAQGASSAGSAWAIRSIGNVHRGRPSRPDRTVTPPVPAVTRRLVLIAIPTTMTPATTNVPVTERSVPVSPIQIIGRARALATARNGQFVALEV